MCVYLARSNAALLIMMKWNEEREACALSDKSLPTEGSDEKNGEPLQEVTAGRRDSNISNSSGSSSTSGSTITIT